MYLPPYVRRQLPNPASQQLQRDRPQAGAAHFFSRYEAHYRYAVMHFGGTAAIRAAIDSAGLHIGRDVQINQYHANNPDCIVAGYFGPS